MSEITPERLKGLAEAVGKKVITDPNTISLGGYHGDYFVVYYDKDYWQYQPHKNWNQCGELLEWLIQGRDTYSMLKIFKEIIKYKFDLDHLKTAIVLVALAYVESK